METYLKSLMETKWRRECFVGLQMLRGPCELNNLKLNGGYADVIFQLFI